MKSLTGSILFTNTVLNSLKAEGQRAWYGVARDLVVDDLARPDSLEDERKGYKYDETADIRSLLDHFMTTTAADKAIACFKSSNAKADEWNRLDVPDNNDILMFFRSRSLEQPPSSSEQAQEEPPAEPSHQPEHGMNRFSAAKTPGYKPGTRMQNHPSQPGPGKKPEEDAHQDPQAQGDYRAQITGKSTKRTLLQELTAKLKKQEAQAQHLKTPHSRYPRQRRYYDSADYP